MEDRTAPAVVIPIVGNNVNVSRTPVVQPDNQAEPTIAVDPAHPQLLFAASMTFQGSDKGVFFDPNVNVPNIDNPELADLRNRTLGMYGTYSMNGGTTWTGRRLFTGGPTGAGENSLPAASADPQVVFDSQGNLFMTYLSVIHQFGTASGGTAGTNRNGGTNGTLVDNTRHWVNGMWDGSYITAYTPVPGGRTVVEHKQIRSNTVNTITINGRWTTPTANTTYVIYAGALENTNQNTPIMQLGGAVVLVRSTDGGQTFSLVKILDRGGTPGVDYPTLAVGPGSNPNQTSVWVAWRPAPSNVQGGGLMYNPLRVNGASVTAAGVGNFMPNDEEIPGSAGANLASAQVGPNGELMVSFQTFGNAATIYVSVDANGLNAGGFWANPVQVATTNIVNPPQVGLPIKASPRNGITPQVEIAWDRSVRLFNGGVTRVYLVYTSSTNPLNINTNPPWDPDDPNARVPAPANNDTDIYVRYSDNGGQTWVVPPNNGLIHANAHSQFLPAISVDQTTGMVAVAYLDSDTNSNDTRVRTMVAVSGDGAASWNVAPASAGMTDASRTNQWMTGTLAAAPALAGNLTVNNPGHVNWPVNYWANSRYVVQIGGMNGPVALITGNQGNQLSVLFGFAMPINANTPFVIRPSQTKTVQVNNRNVQRLLLRSYAFDFGEHIDVAFNNGLIYPIWSDNSNSTNDNPNGANNTLDLYTSKVQVLNLGGFPPIANQDGFQTVQAGTLDVAAPGVLANDTDEEDDPMTAVLVSAPANAASFQLYADGSFTYQPVSTFVGTDSFSYKASDADGDSNTVVVTLEVNSPIPVATPDYYVTAEGQTLDVPAPGVLDNDVDDAGNSLTPTLLTNPANAASFQFYADGSFSYTPNAGFVGIDSFTYLVNNGSADSDPTTVQIFVNNPPDAQPDSYSTQVGQDLDVLAPGILSNDSDPDGASVTVSAINGDAQGIGNAVTLPSGAQVTLLADGSFTYIPAGGYAGQDSFEYTITDGVDFATATVNIDVQAVASIGNFVWVDLNGDGIQDSGEYGFPGLTVSLYDSSYALVAATTTASDGSYGFYNITPGDYYLAFEQPSHYMFSPQYQGSDTSLDSDPDPSGATAVFTLLENETKTDLDAGLVFFNQPPTAVDDDYSVLHDQALATSSDGPNYPVTENDMDYDGDAKTVVEIIASDNSVGTVGSAFTLPSGASVTMQADGNFSYTPPASWTGTDSFSYTLTDGYDFVTAVVTVMVTNQPPDATTDTYGTAQDQPLTIDTISGVLSNDGDPDGDDIWVSAVNGNPSKIGQPIATAEGGTLTLNKDGSFTYEPPVGFTGTDSFTYEVTDGLATSVTTVYLGVF